VDTGNVVDFFILVLIVRVNAAVAWTAMSSGAERIIWQQTEVEHL
jgi:hypothetical protein